ncbi:carboxylic ester hydrolase [Luteimicrobium album]|uniref:Carboxylic ester hydrolase n=1 Tax=Luteimicrobium album TaxID=1054550 RepID=A0ABQ6I5P4_9MICO|nr:carboxylesterase/lipase family protein [Luteimicrobium album]GMA26109.1 carboxylic ester hydrolase [Luteimicrobium album]
MTFRVATESGVVVGETDGGARVWRGLPYAASPVGAGRWRRPRPVQPWTGTRDATRFGAACPQRRLRAGGGVPPTWPRTEDCLTLNVWAPPVDADDLRPVVVWVHGGAFVAGSGMLADFNGARLAVEGDVVVVTLNYRLGALGFLDLSSLATPDEPFDANTGLWDVVEALRWLRENVASFGGDPGRMTLAGESAGASVVTALLAAPAARGLFHRAVALSPAPAAAYSADRMASYARRLLDLVGADPDDAASWRRIPADDLVAAGTRLLAEVDERYTGTIAFAPSVDGVLLPESPVDAALGGRTAPVPLLTGTMRNEALLFLRARPRILPVAEPRVDRVFELLAEQRAGETADRDLDDRGEDDDAALQDGVLAAYPGYPEREALLDFAGDSTFRIPTIRFAEGHGQVAPVWMYRCDFATPSERMARLDATHGTEIPLVFDTLDAPVGRLIVLLGGRSAAQRVGARIRQHLVGLARDGTPGFGWPRYTPPDRTTLILDRDVRIARDPGGPTREAWDAVEFLR